MPGRRRLLFQPPPWSQCLSYQSNAVASLLAGWQSFADTRWASSLSCCLPSAAVRYPGSAGSMRCEDFPPLALPRCSATNLSANVCCL